MFDLIDIITDLKQLSLKYSDKTAIEELILHYEQKVSDLEKEYELEFSSDIDLV